MKETPQRGAAAGNGYERRDMSVRVVGAFLLALIVAIILMLLLMWWMFDHFAAREAKVDVPPSPLAVAEIPPEPRLQETPGRELKALRTEEDALLNSYGWVDRKAGIVRMPIDQAMKLLAERGVPVRSDTPPTR